MSEAKAGIDRETVDQVANFGGENYKYGFTTDIDADKAPNGLNADIIRFISAKKEEPEWLLEWRLDAFERWQTMQEPDWAHVDYPKIDYQDLCYYAAPKSMEDGPKSLDEVDPELLRTYEKLGIPPHQIPVPLTLANDGLCIAKKKVNARRNTVNSSKSVKCLAKFY